MLLLETKNLEKWFEARKLFADINFSIYSGDRIAVIGRNGTGKTTMINLILGLDRDSSGEINKKTNIGYLPQYYNYKSEQTVEEFMTEKTYNYGEFLKLMKKFGFKVDFLDQTVTEVWELNQQQLKTYSGNYSEYKKQKEIELQRQYREYEEYQAQKKRLKQRKRKQQQFVQKTDGKGKRTDSFWYVTKGSDRRKDRFAKQVKSLESQIEKLEKKEKPFEHRQINPDFERKEIASQIIVEAKDLTKSFGDLNLFENINFKIEKDSKIALMGANGSYDQYQKFKEGEYKSGEDLEQEIIQMKKAELYARLEEAAVEEKEEIIIELENLNSKADPN